MDLSSAIGGVLLLLVDGVSYDLGFEAWLDVSAISISELDGLRESPDRDTSDSDDVEECFNVFV